MTDEENKGQDKAADPGEEGKKEATEGENTTDGDVQSEGKQKEGEKSGEGSGEAANASQ